MTHVALDTMRPLQKGLLGRLGAMARYWRAYARAFSELSSLNDYELTDVGVSRCDFSWIARQAALAGLLRGGDFSRHGHAE
jgi:uncharacterized protein YjiS (DUF1127 family)